MINGLPERLKELRLKNGLTQKLLAERLNVSPSVISSYELGERTPSMEMLISLSYVYNCSTDYLLGRKKSIYEGQTLDVNGLSDEQIEAIQTLIKTMKPKQQ